MTTREQNDYLTQTGPGTPMGDLFRCYWIPVMHADEVGGPGGPPVRVKLLSERLLTFRDSDGKVGLIDEFCAHRGVSLWFGRNEDSGIRCPYHGWKYDVTGQCVDVPSEPAENGFCSKIKLKSYPCVELGDVIWTYMGPPDLQPPLPGFEWTQVPQSHRPSVVPAPRRIAQRFPACRKGRRIRAQHRRPLRSGGNRRRHDHRRPPLRRAGFPLLAYHPMDHAIPQHDSAVWQQRPERSRLGADR
jgi:nitrite reductase/ring-hydroxylating ferredoxin subunit